MVGWQHVGSAHRTLSLANQFDPDADPNMDVDFTTLQTNQRYFNVHTQAPYAGGEIRGQITDQHTTAGPATGTKFAAGFEQVVEPGGGLGSSGTRRAGKATTSVKRGAPFAFAAGDGKVVIDAGGTVTCGSLAGKCSGSARAAGLGKQRLSLRAGETRKVLLKLSRAQSETFRAAGKRADLQVTLRPRGGKAISKRTVLRGAAGPSAAKRGGVAAGFAQGATHGPQSNCPLL